MKDRKETGGEEVVAEEVGVGAAAGGGVNWQGQPYAKKEEWEGRRKKNKVDLRIRPRLILNLKRV